MAKFKVNDHVRWAGDNYTQLYNVTSVSTTLPATYTIQSISGPEAIHHNVPEGDMIIATD